jgi:PAS domain S-box-containing protein
MFALDARGTVHVWNRASEELFGWPASDAVGGPPPFLESPDELDALTAVAFSGETVHSHEANYQRRDGRPLDVNVSVAPLRNAAGRVVSAVVVVADVSDQRRAELALRESEVRFRSLVQESSDMVTIVDADGRATYRSPSASRFLGLDPDEATERSSDLGLFEADRPVLRALFDRLRAHPGASETVRYRFERHDGELRWIEMVATNHLADEAVRGIVTNCRDVTDRVEAEQTVRASEERLRAMLANISDVISVLDADGGLTYTSPSIERVYGYKEGEWPEAQQIFDTVHPDDRQRVFDFWEGSISTPGEFHPLEIRLRKVDGSWIHTEIIANNLLADPSVNGIVVTSRDITQRKESEEALRASEARLRESQARYRAIVDDQTELVCRYLPDATLTFTNRAFSEFFGSGSADLAGAKLVDLRPASERVRTLEWLSSFASGGTVRTHVEREVSVDGSLRWYEWTDRAFANEAGEIVEFQSVGTTSPISGARPSSPCIKPGSSSRSRRGVPLTETLLTIARALEDQFPALLVRNHAARFRR